MCYSCSRPDSKSKDSFRVLVFSKLKGEKDSSADNPDLITIVYIMYQAEQLMSYGSSEWY